jgi:hypothetical protein
MLLYRAGSRLHLACTYKTVLQAYMKVQFQVVCRILDVLLTFQCLVLGTLEMMLDQQSSVTSYYQPLKRCTNNHRQCVACLVSGDLLHLQGQQLRNHAKVAQNF